MFLICGTPPHPGPTTKLLKVWCALCPSSHQPNNALTDNDKVDSDGYHIFKYAGKLPNTTRVKCVPRYVFQAPSNADHAIGGVSLLVSAKNGPGWFLTKPLKRVQPPEEVQKQLHLKGASTQICSYAYQTYTTFKDRNNTHPTPHEVPHPPPPPQGDSADFDAAHPDVNSCDAAQHDAAHPYPAFAPAPDPPLPGDLLADLQRKFMALQRENTSLQSDVRRLTGKVRTMKPATSQLTIDGVFAGKHGTLARAKVANGFDSPRAVVDGLGIRNSNGTKMAEKSRRQAKYTTPVDELKKSEHSKTFQRLMSVCHAGVMTVLNGIHAVPAEAVKLLHELCSKHDPTGKHPGRYKSSVADSKLVENLVKSYNDATNDKERRVIAFVLVSEFKLKQCQQLGLLPRMTRWAYQNAKYHLDVWGAGRPAVDIPITRQRIPLEVMREALAFIYDPSNIQQVAFGDKHMHIKATGETFDIPAVLRTKLKEEIWLEYRAHNTEVDGRYTGLERTAFLKLCTDATLL